MNGKLQVAAFCAALALAGSTARAVPVGITVDLYETVNNLPDGTATETGNWVSVPALPDNQYVVILEPGDNGHGQPHWSDVLEFGNTDSGPSVRLLSRIDSNGNPLWPGDGTVNSSKDPFINEDATGLATFQYSSSLEPANAISALDGFVGTITINAQSDPDINNPPGGGNNVPDGGTTMLLFGVATIGLGVVHRRIGR